MGEDLRVAPETVFAEIGKLHMEIKVLRQELGLTQRRLLQLVKNNDQENQDDEALASRITE